MQLWSLLGISLCLTICRLPAENLSRTPPEHFARLVQPLLTPAEPLLEQKPMEAAQETGGEIVLFERIVHVLEDGRRLAAVHYVSRAATEAGVEALERDVDEFHRRRQRVSLALAHTITPDGKKLPVRENAAFIQTPQRAQDNDTYNDLAEAVIIFPDVKKGSATEYVLVEEDVTPRIPGQFTGASAFSGYWPAAVMRQVVELPRSMADRLTITTLGATPDVRREEVDGGKRVRFTWEAKSVKPDAHEPGRPGWTQTGPAVFLTTLRSWEEFTAWYWPQVEPQLTLNDALRAKVDEWTRDAKSRDEVIAALLRRASDDVRYVGLEFADGDLVPRPVTATWENQYGDCKDKSCLLVAMLAHKGIRAHPALINTDFPGRVERRSPDFRHFDHCIVAVEKEGGGWLFCDPTIAGLQPGMIGAGDGDRDVLLVKPGAEWARTPQHDWGVMRHRIEAEMDAAGGLSGWMRIEAEGSNAAYQAWRETKDTREELLDRMRNFLSGFSGGIRVVDVKKHGAPPPGQPWRMDVYFLVPGGGGRSLAFPADTNYVPNTGNRRERESLWPFWRERVETTARVKLPPGLAAEKLPPAYKASSRYADAEAAWEWKDGAVESRFLLVTRESAVTPADWPGFADQMNAFRAWLSQPLPLREGEAPAGSAPAEELAGFALMPSVDGQIDLVEEKYPAAGNAKLRRAALEKAITLFPGDKDLLLRAGWRLATMDINEERPADALRRIESFLESCRSAAPAEEAGAADYMRALAMARLRRLDEATALWQQLADDPALSGFRRTWANWQIARVLMAKDGSDRAAIISVLEKGMALHSENEEVLYPFWVTLQLGGDGREKVEKAFKSLTADRPGDASRILCHVIEYTSDTAPGKRQLLLEILRGLGKPEDLGDQFASLLRNAEASLAMIGIAGKLREQASAEIKAHAKAFTGIELPAAAKTSADFLEAAKELNEKGVHPNRATRFAFEALSRSGDGDNVAELVWECCSYAEWWSRAVPDAKTRAVLESAFALGEMLPLASGNGQECRLLQANVLHRSDKLDEARAKLESLAAVRMEDYPHTHTAALQLLARIAEAEARWDDAMKLHTELMEQTPEASAVAAWHAACIAILREQWDEAFTWIERLRAVPEKAREAAAFHDQMQKLLDLAAHREEALAWWKGGAVWWVRWSKEVQKAAPQKRVQHPRVAEIPGIETMGALLGERMNAGDKPGGMDVMHSIASAARVHPYFMFEFGVVATPNDVAPQFKPLSPWCRAAARAAAPFFPAHDAALLRQWLVVSAALDLQEKDYKGMDRSARRFQTLAHDADEFNARMAVLWLAAVVDGRLPADDAVAAGRAALASKEMPEELRPNLVFLLAFTLKLNNNPDEGKALLDKEMAALPREHPLLPRLAVLRKDLDSAGLPDKLPALTPGVPPEVFLKWMTQNKPAWLDYADPQSLDDPRLKDVKQALRLNGPFSVEEQIKAAWLLAKAGKIPDDESRELSRIVIGVIARSYGDAAKHRAVNSVVSRSEWPAAEQSHVLKSLGWRAIKVDALRLLKPWMQLPPGTSPESRRDQEILALRLMAGLDPDSEASLKKIAGLLDLKDESLGTAASVGFIVRRLFALGHSATAHQLVNDFRMAQPDDHTTAALECRILTDYLKEAEALRPCHEALRDAVMQAFPECATMAEPVEALRKAGGLRPEDLLREDAATARQLFLWAVKQRLYDHNSLEIWSVPGRHGRAQDLGLRRRMMEIVFQFMPDGGRAGEALDFCRQNLDMDDPAERQVRESLLTPLRGREDLPPALAEALQVSDLAIALRTGAGGDPLKVLASLKIPVQRSRAAALALDAALSQGDRVLMERLLKELPADELPAPGMFVPVLCARKTLGVEAEWKKTADLARKLMRRFITAGWAHREVSDLHLSVRLAEALGEPDLVPAGLLPDVERWLRNDFALTSLRVRLAALRSDWKECADRAAHMIREYPAWHEYKFFHGLACHHLGRKDEARDSLSAFLAIVHNEPECATARALLTGTAP